MTTTDTPPTSITRTRDGWEFKSAAELTDEQAAALTFQAEPETVRLGTFVAVVDAGGTRIGHVKSATYHRRAFGPAYVVATIELL